MRHFSGWKIIFLLSLYCPFLLDLNLISFHYSVKSICWSTTESSPCQMILLERTFNAYFLDYLAAKTQLFNFSAKTIRNCLPGENSKHGRLLNRCTLNCFVTRVYLFLHFGFLQTCFLFQNLNHRGNQLRCGLELQCFFLSLFRYLQ